MSNRAKILDMVDFNIEQTTGTKVPAFKNTANEWLASWFSLNKVKFNYDGNHQIYDVNKEGVKEINQERLYGYIIVGTGIINNSKIRPLIQPFIDNWEFRERAIVKKNLIDKLSFKAEEADNNLILQYVEALTGKKDYLDIAVIYNFIHSVKRKMCGDWPDIDLFTILQGDQNSGKSTSVRKLLSPINRFWTDRTLDMLNQEKNLKVLSQKNVVWFDEMARAKRADVDAIKKYTTATHISFRQFYTQREVRFRNVSVFIGCTNRTVAELIYDPTGARRFYELACLSKINHSVINSIDYVKLWQSVDESSPSLLSNYSAELADHQQLLKSMDNIEEFLTQESLLPTEDSETMEVKFKDLYSAYSRWLTSQKMTGQFKKKNFAKRLNELGVQPVRKSDARYRCIKKNDDFYNLLP